MKSKRLKINGLHLWTVGLTKGNALNIVTRRYKVSDAIAKANSVIRRNSYYKTAVNKIDYEGTLDA